MYRSALEAGCAAPAPGAAPSTSSALDRTLTPVSRGVRVPLSVLAPGERWLEPEAAHYLARVHRLRAGDVFTAFDPALRVEAEGRLVEISGPRVRCQLSAPIPARLVSPLELTLLQGAGKGDKVDQVVRDATELGARRVIAVVTERAIHRGEQRSATKLGRWRAIAAQAARQCGRGDVPDIEGPEPLAAAVGRLSGGMRLMLDGAGPRCLAAALEGWKPAEPIALLVGPEGGLSPSDRCIAEGAGFLGVSFGPFTLRTETAATAALAAVLAAARLEGSDPSLRA